MNRQPLMRPSINFIFVVCCSAAVLGVAITRDPKSAIALAFLPMLVCLALQRPTSVLYLLLFFLPFQSVPALSENLAGIPGAKLSNLLAAVSLVVLFMQEGNLLCFRDPIEKKALYIMAVYLFFFTVSFFRSLEKLPLLHVLIPDQFKSLPISYILSFYVKPALYLVPPLVIIKKFRSRKQVDMVVNVLLASTFILSCSIIIIALSNFGEFSQGRGAMREIYSNYIGMHYNGIGTIYVVMFPLFFYKISNRIKIFWILHAAMAMISVILLQSRSTIIGIVLSVALFLRMTKNIKLMVIIAVSCLLLSIMYIPDAIINNLSTGVSKGTADAMLTGRVSSMWIPLLNEWVNDPRKLFFGGGEWSMVTSPLWIQGIVFQATHAHNAFINFALNNGVVLLTVLVLFIIKMMNIAWKSCWALDNKLCWAFYASIFGYLVGTISERFIYPHQDNMLLLPVIALMVNLIRIQRYPSHDDIG